LKRFPFPNPEFPILFISHEFPESKDKQQSKSNDLERKCIIQLDALLRRQLEISADDIGIISFYSSQVNKLLQELQEAGFEDVPMDSVAMAERFQGKEKSVILISCVRSSQTMVKNTNFIFITSCSRFICIIRVGVSPNNEKKL
jgi:superfamily I DNA and/or RNA helicase